MARLTTEQQTRIMTDILKAHGNGEAGITEARFELNRLGMDWYETERVVNTFIELEQARQGHPIRGAVDARFEVAVSFVRLSAVVRASGLSQSDEHAVLAHMREETIAQLIALGVGTVGGARHCIVDAECGVRYGRA